MNDAIRKTHFSNFLLRTVGQADPPASHHFDDEHLDAGRESINCDELFQKAIVHIVVGFLEIVIELNDFLSLFFIKFEARFSSTASLHPWDVLTPL